MVREPVGTCVDCGKTVYCESGFLSGIVLENHRLRCYDCQEEQESSDDDWHADS